LEGWPPAEGGARLAGMEGDGDERDRMVPLVWMPGGIGRLILVETVVVVGVATAVGAIVYGPAAAGGSNVGGRFRISGIAPTTKWCVCSVVCRPRYLGNQAPFQAISCSR
jgi:hypothetical protein